MKWITDNDRKRIQDTISLIISKLCNIILVLVDVIIYLGIEKFKPFFSDSGMIMLILDILSIFTIIFICLFLLKYLIIFIKKAYQQIKDS